MNRKMIGRSRIALVWLLLRSLTLLPGSYGGSDTLEVPEYVNCACPGDVLTYRCNIIGGGTTLWGGTTFDCSTTMNEIRLRHSQFPASEGGTMGSCNNEAMQARSIGLTNGNCYTSELTVTVNPSFNTKTVQCAHSPITGPERIISSSMLTVLSAREPPGDVRFTDVRDGQFVLNWTSVLPTCDRVYYSVTSNCSTCSAGVTNLTTGSCSLPQMWTDGLACAFSVQSVVCGNLIGRSSNPVVVKLQVPIMNIIPHYSEANNTLTRFTVRGTNFEIAKSDGRTIYLEEFNVTFSDPDTENIIYSLPTATCGEDECDIEITPAPPSSLSQVCPLIGTVAADYGLGQRLLSDPITIECTNRFVDVRYDSSDSIISCTFLNRTDTSIKSCTVTYGPCDQQQSQTTVLGMSTVASPNNVTLSILPQGSCCYSVIASDGDVIVAIDGRINNVQSESKSLNTAAIVGIAVASVLMIPVVILGIILLKRRNRQKVFSIASSNPLNIIHNYERELKLQPIKVRNFTKLEIEKDCKLREAIEDHSKKVFKRGHAYYEFTHKIENISVEKELIFTDEDTGEYFTSQLPRDDLGLYGEGVRKPDYGKYKVFVQSTGSGARHLPARSLLLYEQVQSEQWNPEEAPLQPVISNHFVITPINKECTVEEFKEENNLTKGGANVFMEYTEPVKKDSIRDVILSKKKTRKLFTGPTARSQPSAYLDEYKVFVLQYDSLAMKLKPGHSVLHQVQNSKGSYTVQPFYVLDVDDDNVQMSEFVKEKLKVKFENGKAFYEFTQREEDLLYYKDVVVIPKSLDLNKPKEVSGDGNKIFDLTTSLRRFYWLSKSVPDVGIKPPSLKDNRVFVQSTSQGSRCLKSKTLLLYRV